MQKETTLRERFEERFPSQSYFIAYGDEILSFIEQEHSLLLEQIKGCVPERINQNIEESAAENLIRHTWNNCRSLTLKNIDNLKNK